MSLKMLMIHLFERVLKIVTPNLSGLQVHGHYFFIKRLNKGVTEGPTSPKLVASMWYRVGGSDSGGWAGGGVRSAGLSPALPF